MHLIKIILLFISTFFITVGCNNKLIITSEFVINNSQKELNGFQITQIFPSDNLKPPSTYTENIEFRYSFVTDSSFKWEKKIYFNKPQRGFKWVPLFIKGKIDTIGKLKNECWYLFEGLSDSGYLYFVYIDNQGNSEIYEVNKSNY